MQFVEWYSNFMETRLSGDTNSEEWHDEYDRLILPAFRRVAAVE